MAETRRLTKSYLSDDPNISYAADHSLRLHPAQEKLIKITMQHPAYHMMGSPDELQLLQNLVRCIGAKKTIEIGVYTGLSAMSVALALPDDGKLIACDINEDFAKLGKPYWQEAGVADKIDLRIGPAIETLESLIANGEAGTFDFAFIDADKANYDNYYELCLQLIRKNGIIAIDNMLWGGQVHNPEVNDISTVALRNLAQKVHRDERVNVSFLIIGDGTELVFKK